MLWVKCLFVHRKYSLRKEKAGSGYPLPANVIPQHYRFFRNLLSKNRRMTARKP